jgi:DNA-binding transcriptional regulator YiaG
MNDFPRFEEMAAFMEAEMVRMGMEQTASMTTGEAKAALIQAGLTQTAFADRLGVSLNSVSRVINGTLRSQRIEAELQKITGKPLHDTPSVRGRRRTVWTGQATTGAAA